SRTSTENIIVRCTLTDGSVGWGEGVPREYVTGETADTSLDLLRDTDLAKQLPSCEDFAAAVRLAEGLSLTSPSPPGFAGGEGREKGEIDRQCRGNSARCALEIAILDAFGRSFGENLTGVTELAAPDIYEFRPRVQYSGVVTSSRGMK